MCGSPHLQSQRKLGGRHRWIAGVHWTASLASLVNFQPMRRLVLNKTERGTEKHPRQSSDLHMHVHTHGLHMWLMYVYMNKNTCMHPCVHAVTHPIQTMTETDRRIRRRRAKLGPGNACPGLLLLRNCPIQETVFIHSEATPSSRRSCPSPGPCLYEPNSSGLLFQNENNSLSRILCR